MSQMPTSGFDWSGLFSNFTNLFGGNQPVASQSIPTVPIAGQAAASSQALPVITPQVMPITPQTSGESMGFSDRGMMLGSVLGTLASAIDPEGWGGRLGGGVASMTKGEQAARNSRDVANLQRAQNLEMMQALTQSIQNVGQPVSSPTASTQSSITSNPITSVPSKRK